MQKINEVNKLKIEKLLKKDGREGSGTLPYLLVGFKIVAEKEEEKFFEDFSVLHEDTNGHMEVDIEKDNINIYTFKTW